MSATITTIYKSYVNGQEFGTISVLIPSADALTLNSTPIDLIAAPGTGKGVLITESIFRIDTYGGTPYATNTTLNLVYDTSLAVINGFNSALAAVATTNKVPSNGVSMATAQLAPGSVSENKKVQAYVPSGNPTAGNSDIVLYISYKIIPTTA